MLFCEPRLLENMCLWVIDTHGYVRMHTHEQTRMQIPKCHPILLAKDFHLGSVYIACTLQIKGRRESLVYGVKSPIGRMVNHKPA